MREPLESFVMKWVGNNLSRQALGGLGHQIKEVRGMKGWVVQRLIKEVNTNVYPVNLVTKEHLGVLSVFRTKKDARNIWGKDISLVEITIGENK